MKRYVVAARLRGQVRKWQIGQTSKFCIFLHTYGPAGLTSQLRV